MGEIEEEKLTWANVDLENEAELERFEEEELDRAARQIKEVERPRLVLESVVRARLARPRRRI